MNNVEQKVRREADAERAWALKCAVLDDEVRDKSGAHVPTPTVLRLAASQAITEQVEGRPVQRVENTGAGGEPAELVLRLGETVAQRLTRMAETASAQHQPKLPPPSN